MITVEIMNGASCVSIEGEMTIYTAREQKEKLMQSLSESDAMDIDLAGVNEMDTAGLQLLLLMKTEAMRMGKRISIVKYGPAILEVFNLYYLHRHFDMSEASTATA